MDGRAATVAEFQMAGHEIGVEVGEKYVPDLQAEGRGIGQVLLNIALRIDNDGGRAGLVSKQIRSVRQASQVILLQKHTSFRSIHLRIRLAAEVQPRSSRCFSRASMTCSTRYSSERHRSRIWSKRESTSLKREST